MDSEQVRSRYFHGMTPKEVRDFHDRMLEDGLGQFNRERQERIRAAYGSIGDIALPRPRLHGWPQEPK